MPELREQADAETLAITYLASIDAIVDIVGAGGISGELPPDFTRGDSHLRVLRIGGFARDRGFLDRARLQVDAYGPTALDAHALAVKALNALLLLPTSGFDTDGPVVTGAEPDVGLRNAADLEQDGAPRYLFGVILYVHPGRD